MVGTGGARAADGRDEGMVPSAPTARRPGARGAAAVLAVAAAVLAACSLHVTNHGISGNILGHSFSGATGALPTGFPSDVPVPDNSRVLAGGGAQNNWDVAFAVKGTVSAGTAAYQSKLRSAGYTVSNVQSGSADTPTSAASGAKSTQTTITVSGSTFTAKDAKWTVQVASGTTSANTNGEIKPGEFALNITVVPTSPAGG